MKHIWFSILFFAVSTLIVFAQDKDDEEKLADKKWALKGITGVNLSQSAFSNWSAGGENALAGNAYLNGSLKRKSGHWLWVNNLVLEYGMTKNKSLGVQKTNDKIDFSTQIGYTTNDKWYYTGMADFKSQFYKGYNYPNKDNYISKFMAPGYSNVSIGIEYRPNDHYSIYFSPMAGKMTFVTDDYLSDMGAFGVDEGKKFRAEFGAYLKARAEQKLMENVTAISTVDFFSAYDKSFGNVDINWDVMINMKINKFLSATLNTTLRYDDDVKYISKDGTKKGPRVQFKEVLGIGVAYNF